MGLHETCKAPRFRRVRDAFPEANGGRLLRYATPVGGKGRPRKPSPLSYRVLALLAAAEGGGLYQHEIGSRLRSGHGGGAIDDALNRLYEGRLVVFLLDDYVEITPAGVEEAGRHQ